MTNLSEKKTARQELIPHFRQDVLKEGRILLVGAGATGNEVLKNLGLVGCGGYVLICDMDHISTSNLSRTILFTEEDVGKRKAATAAQRFEAMHIDHGHADSFEGDICCTLGEGLVSQFDVVIGCTDNVQTRLYLNHLCQMLGIPYVDTGINKFDYTLFVGSGKSSCACYACTMSEQDEKREMSRVRNSCDVTRKHAAAMGHAPTIVLSAAEVGARAAQEVLRIIHHKKADHAGMFLPNYGRLQLYCAETNSTRNLLLPVRKDCSQHHCYADLGDIIQTPISCKWKLRDVLAWVETHYGAGYCLSLLKDCIYADRAFVTTAYCKHCGEPVDVYRPQYELEDEDLLCPACREAHLAPQFPSDAQKKVFFDAESSGERILEMTLHEIGIPAAHLLQFDHNEEGHPSLFLVMRGDFAEVAPQMPG